MPRAEDDLGSGIRPLHRRVGHAQQLHVAGCKGLGPEVPEVRLIPDLPGPDRPPGMVALPKRPVRTVAADQRPEVVAVLSQMGRRS